MKSITDIGASFFMLDVVTTPEDTGLKMAIISIATVLVKKGIEWIFTKLKKSK